MSGYDDDKDKLFVPAGFARATIGLVIMVAGVLVAALTKAHG